MGRSELYIGNLNKDVSSRDIENVFKKHGKVLRCEVKNKGYGAVYAFIEFDDERDAEDALIHENGKDMCGSSMVVEFTKGKGRRGPDRGGYRGVGGGGPRGGRDVECYECGERGHFARDCRRRNGGGGGSRGGYRDRSRDRSRDRRRDRSRDRSRERDRSRDRHRDRSRSRDRYRSRDRSAERSSKRDKRRDRSDDKSSRDSRSPSKHRSKTPGSRSRTKSKTPRSRSPSYNKNDGDLNGSGNHDTNGNHEME